MDANSKKFITALQQNDFQTLAGIPKSDLHNHASLGSRFEKFVQHFNCSVPTPPDRFDGVKGMDAYLRNAVGPVLLSRAGFEYSIHAAFEQAVEDGVSLLRMSVDTWFVRYYTKGARDMTEFIAQTAQLFAARCTVIPQIGFSRELDAKTAMKEVMPFLETGFFRSIDLYGDEDAREPEYFREIFREARRGGLQLVAHAGESLDAEAVRHAVDALDLDEVQHGIGAAQSAEVMQWLHERGTRLNVCPSSNVALGIIPCLKDHPIRILADNGVRVTINTDDLLLFGQSVSDEYMNLFRAGSLPATQLDRIRLEGLRPKQ